jgi:AraC-like DNA-binding protein
MEKCALQKIIVTLDDLPPGLDEKARFSTWNDRFNAIKCRIDCSRIENRPFTAHFEATAVGMTRTALCNATVNKMVRTPQTVVAEGVDEFVICINRGDTPMLTQQLGRKAAVDPGAAVLMSMTEPGSVRANAFNYLMVGVPRTELAALIPDLDDATIRPLDPAGAPLRHLRRYVAFLHSSDNAESDPALAGHIHTTLKDLFALTVGAGRDAAHVARMRGLRAARLREILAAIRANFANPAFSPRHLAQRLALSPRYVQALLHETGVSFTERVLELRLQKARAMLMSHQNGRLRVSEIAYTCGFGEISYFNQAFRRRFGASPMQYRGANNE